MRKKGELYICHIGKKLWNIFMSFKSSSIFLRKQRSPKDRSAYDSDTGNFRITYVDTHTYAMSSVYFLFDTLPYQTLSQFSAPSHLRTHVSPWQHASLPLTLAQHRKHTSAHVLHPRTIKQYVIVLVAITLLLHQTDIYLYALVSEVSSSLGETRSSVGKNHSTRISPSARITVAECPSNISSGSLRARCFSRSMLENHTDRAWETTVRATFFDGFRRLTKRDGRTNGRNGRKRAGWYEIEDEEDGVVAGWLDRRPARGVRSCSTWPRDWVSLP